MQIKKENRFIKTSAFGRAIQIAVEVMNNMPKKRKKEDFILWLKDKICKEICANFHLCSLRKEKYPRWFEKCDKRNKNAQDIVEYIEAHCGNIIKRE